ncbi:collagen-like triple helix repeat-containing protein [uncultured Oxalicibacterium sp.]|uniref:collagen-like triple helix repeat-containing protein n=1 Tax=uncultured Oxalicibacterium sp. TaxID=1168540 RepID=UPI0025DBC92C|nr:collagen-like triple helix repeat-containing protein [uncultured Oxalicibacterium sp.]
MKTTSPFGFIPLSTLVLVAALTGCASGSGSTSASLGGSNGSVGGNSGGGADGSGGGNSAIDNVSSPVSPMGQVAGNAGNLVTATGGAISALGATVENANVGIVPAQTQSDLARVVDDTDGVVQTLGQGVSDGLGQIGNVQNPLGVTVANTGNVVERVGQTTQDTGTLVANTGGGPLSPLAPVTQPVGGLVNQVGVGVSNASPTLTNALSSGPVEQVTQTGSNVITPLTARATTLTQQVGNATGLDEPVDGMLGRVGGGLDSVGQSLTGGSELGTGLGTVVSSAGQTVSSAGVILHDRQGTGGSNLISGLTNTVGGLAGGGMNGIGGVGASVGATVDVLVGVNVNNDAANGTTIPSVLTPIRNLTSGVTGLVSR